MSRLAAIGLLLLAAGGCLSGVPYGGPIQQPTAAYCQNPVFLAHTDHRHVWKTVVDVVDDYFKIEREEPTQLIGNVLTEGRLDTFAEVGSTVFEPWRQDSASAHEKLESTLQSIRRRAKLTVVPDDGGYWVSVTVFKELEDVTQPTRATAGAATFRNDSSLTRVVSPVGEQEINEGWIPRGRDAALEQRILSQLQTRLYTQPMRVSPLPAFQ